MKRIEKRRYSDRPGYLTHFVVERRRKLKRMAIELKGGKCQVCGYKRCVWALDFHHYDDSTKKFNLSMEGMSKSWKLIAEEVSKCVLVCSNCHREIHSGITSISKNLLD